MSSTTPSSPSNKVSVPDANNFTKTYFTLLEVIPNIVKCYKL